MELNGEPIGKLRVASSTLFPPPGRELPAEQVEDKTPLDVIVLIQSERSSFNEELLDATEVVRQGVDALMDATFSIPGSRFGLFGYQSGRGRTALSPSPSRGVLLDQSQQAQLSEKLRSWSIGSTTDTKWFVGSALAAASNAFDDPPDSRGLRRRILIIYSDLADSEATTTLEVIVRTQEILARSQNLEIHYLSPPGHLKPPRKQFQEFFSRSGALVYPPTDKTTESLRQQFASLARSIGKQQRLVISLRAGPVPVAEVISLSLASHPPSDATEIRFPVPKPELTTLPISVPATSPIGARASQASSSRGVLAFAGFSLFLLGVLYLLLRRWVALDGAAFRSTPKLALPANCRVWLHWVDQAKDIPISSLPQCIGNDLECDLVTTGLDKRKQRAVIQSGDVPYSLVVRALDPGSVQNGELHEQEQVVLHDGVEFYVDRQRFKLFFTALPGPEGGA